MLLGVDFLNVWFVMLLLMLLPINLQVSFFESKLKVYNYLLFTLYLALLLSFLVCNMVLFFLLFELIIICMFLLLYAFILSYYRLRSSYWFFVYSLIGSFSMVIGIIVMVLGHNCHVLIFLFVLFLVKVPAFPFNFWLVEVHSEANTSLSLILAALLLKLGIYGLLKYCFNSLASVLLSFSLLGLIVFVLSVVVLVFYNLRLVDFKKIIALSSIVHLNFSLIGLFSASIMAYFLLIINSVAHGFSAFLLFLLFGYVIHKSYTRFIDSLYFLSTGFRALVFASFLINVSFPLSFNFLVELLTLAILLSVSLSLASAFAVISFVSMFFYFLLYNRFSMYTFNMLYASLTELLYCGFLIFVNVFYGIYFLCLL
jgi:NADH:ubiquinone oxidoreductase subunit 4 (subunit M)